MSNTNQIDWTKPLMKGTFTPSHGPVSKTARTISVRSPSGKVHEITEEWIISGIGPVPSPGQAANHWDTPEPPADTLSLAAPQPESGTMPDCATPIDDVLIHPEGFTEEIAGIDSILVARLADAQPPPGVSKHSIRIPTSKGDVRLDTNQRGFKTPPPTPGPPPNSPSKQVSIKTPPPTPGPLPNTPSQRSIGTQTCVKATHQPGCLQPPNCAYPTNRTVRFILDVKVIPEGSSQPEPSATKEHKRPPFHRCQTPANILDLVQEIQVPEHLVRQLDLSKDGTPTPPTSVPPNTPERTEGDAERGVKTPLPSPGSPLNSPSKGLSEDGTPPPTSEPSNNSVKQLAKDPSPPPPSPPPNTPSKELLKGSGGGETPLPPPPSPNSPTEVSKDGTPPPPPSPPLNTPSTRLSRPGTPHLTLVIPNDDGDSHNPRNPKPMIDGDRKRSLVDYISNDDYPSPDRGSDSPITPLWLEMKAMVDKFIFKVDEEEASRNIVKRPESIPLPPSGLTSPAAEAQSPNPSLTPRVLASLENMTIPLRVDEQGRVRAGLKGGAGPRGGGEGEVSSRPVDKTEAELNASIAADVEKIVRHLIVHYNEAITAGEVETAWERGQKAMLDRDTAAMQEARDAWVDEDHQDTPQAIGSLAHIHPDSIDYRLNSPKIVGKHVKANGKIRETVTYFSRERREVEVPLIYRAKGSTLSQVPQWKKELFKLLPPLPRQIQNNLNSGLADITMSTEGIPSGLSTYMVDAMRLDLGSDRVRSGTIPTSMSETTSTHADGNRWPPSSLHPKKDRRKLFWDAKAGAVGQFERRGDPTSSKKASKAKVRNKLDGTEYFFGDQKVSFLYQSLRSDDDVALMGTVEVYDTYLRVIDILSRMFAKDLWTLKCLLIATQASISHTRAKRWEELEELITTVQIHKQEDVFDDIRCYILSRTGKPRSKIEAARMVFEELRDSRQDNAEYWADYQYKTNRLKDFDLRIARVKAGDISAVFQSLDRESWHSLQLVTRYASMPKNSEDGASADHPEDFSRRCQGLNFCLSVFNPTVPYDDDKFQHARQILFQMSVKDLATFLRRLRGNIGGESGVASNIYFPETAPGAALDEEKLRTKVGRLTHEYLEFKHVDTDPVSSWKHEDEGEDLHDVDLKDGAQEWPIKVYQGFVKPEAPLPPNAPGVGPEPDDLPRPRTAAEGRIVWDPCVDTMEECQCEECLAFWKEEGYDS